MSLKKINNSSAKEEKLEKRINLLKTKLNDKLQTQGNSHAISWISEIINKVLDSKVYISSNINDIIFFSNYGLIKCRKVIDFGCGSGYMSYSIASMVDKVVGYEYNGNWVGQEMKKSEYIKAFSYCHRIIKKLKSNVSFRFYESFPLKIKSESIDGVLLYAVIEHLDEQVIDLAFKELNRILKENGCLFIGKLPRKYSYQERICGLLKMGNHENLYSEQQVVNLLHKYGFTVIKIEKTGMFFNHPNKITNFLFSITTVIEQFLYHFFPFAFVISHDYRLVAIKNSNT